MKSMTTEIVKNWEEITNDLFSDGFRIDEVVELVSISMGIYQETLIRELKKEGKA